MSEASTQIRCPYVGGEMERISTRSSALPKYPSTQFNRLPRTNSLPFFFSMRRFYYNAENYIQEQYERNGNVFAGSKAVFLLGAEANALVLGDRHQRFSSQHAYSFNYEIFGDSLIARDFEDHRARQKFITTAFNKIAYQHYFNVTNEIVSRTLPQWENSDDKISNINFYDHIKELMLTIAAKVFADIDLNEQANHINQTLTKMLPLAASALKIAIPGTPYWRGLQARKTIRRYFYQQIPERRNQDNQDLFSRLCNIENEEGKRMSENEIVDNMVGIFFAGHDTSTIALSAIIYLLGKHQDWQEKLREEYQTITPENNTGHLIHEDLNKLNKTDNVIKEALRLYTPLRYLMRRSIEEFEFSGHAIPKNSLVIVSPHFSHKSSDYFDQPEAFNPDRFDNLKENGKHHPYAWCPFGKGAHTCLGMQFAYMEIKIFLYQFLRRYKISISPDYQLQTRHIPIATPIDGVPIKIERV